MKKDIIKNLIDLFSSCFVKAAGIMGNRGKNSLMCSICKSYENNSKEFVSFRKRAKFCDDMKINCNLSGDITDVCVILQGPLKLENNFTLETVKFYTKLYPKCSIVVSTWDTEDATVLREIEKYGATVIKNKKPQKTGLGNMNFQLVSTKAGIKFAENIGAKYVLKTRTDQRVGKYNFLEYMEGLETLFEINNDYLNLGQNQRIIVHQGSTGGNMFIPYFISDFLYFGTTEDIKKLFSIELDEKISMSYKERAEWINGLSENVSVMEYYEKTAPEIKIIKTYIEKYSKKKVKNSVKDYWEFVKNYLICVSWDDIGLFWYKYNYQNESDIFHLFEERDTYDRYLQYNWTFQNWLNLYMDRISYKNEFEEIKEKTSY